MRTAKLAKLRSRDRAFRSKPDSRRNRHTTHAHKHGNRDANKPENIYILLEKQKAQKVHLKHIDLKKFEKDTRGPKPLRLHNSERTCLIGTVTETVAVGAKNQAGIIC